MLSVDHLAQPDTLRSLKAYAMQLTNNKQDAEDLTQDAIERALKKAAHYEQQDGHSVHSWLKTVMRNVWLNKIRDESCHRDSVIDNAGSRKLLGAPAHPDGEDRVFLGEVLATLATMPAQKLPVLLSASGDSLNEIAQKLHTTSLGAGLRIMKGRRKLVEKLKLELN